MLVFYCVLRIVGHHYGEHLLELNEYNAEVYSIIFGMVFSYDPLERLHPKAFSSGCFDLMRGLLDKTWQRRLGTNGGAGEIKAHPFFDRFDWQGLHAAMVKERDAKYF